MCVSLSLSSENLSAGGLPSMSLSLFLSVCVSLSLSLSSESLSAGGLPSYVSKNLMSLAGIAQPLLQLGILKGNEKDA